MSKYAIICDVEKCTGCHSCFLSCKDEHVGNNHFPVSTAQSEGQKWLTLNEVEYGTGFKVKLDYIPVMCQHCANPLCMDGAEDAVYRRSDGIVIIDPEKAVGRKDIVRKCPYGAISWNEESNLPQKCTMCAHLIDAGEKNPRCVECCPTGALVFGDLDDPDSEISKLVATRGAELETFKPQFGTLPSVKYLSLPKPFIAGEVVLADRRDECAIGAKVTLRQKETGCEKTIVTNFLGDFEFKGLERNKEYLLPISVDGYKTETREVFTNAAKNLGEIVVGV